MGINTYEVMYIQARDNYPYNVDECIEKLQYVIAADDEHAGAHYFMGQIYDEQLEDYRQAEYYYRMALYLDKNHISVYYQYAALLCKHGRYEECRRIIDAGLKVAGVDVARLKCIHGQMLEKQHLFKQAAKVYKEAKLDAADSCLMHAMDGHIKRVKDKLALLKPSNKKGKQKKKDKTS
jgi:tetratricopeptide (TPR) repeat protein